jgi:Ca2+-binding RTX toxin-like protein
VQPGEAEELNALEKGGCAQKKPIINIIMGRISLHGIGMKKLTITGTNSSVNIAASANRDVVNGKGGPDRIFGDGGNDALDGGAGSDHIESGDGNNVARGNDGDGDWASVVDNDTNDFVSGGDGTEDVCVVDLVNGVRDEFSDTCEKVYQTASIPQE